MTGGGIIVFALSVRVCGSLITQTCHHEYIADFPSETHCRSAGDMLQVYPNVMGYHCRVETREYQFRPWIGNPF